MADLSAGQPQVHSPSRVPLRTILVIDGIVLAVVLGLYLLFHLRQIVVFLLIATFFAVVLSPAVDFLHRRRVPRAVATTLVFLGGAALLAGTVYLFVRPIYSAGRQFADQLPSVVQQAENGQGHIGELLRRYHVQQYVTDNAPKLNDALSHAGGPALSVARTFISGLAGVFIIGMLSFLILLEGPSLANSALRLLPGEQAERIRRVASDVSRSVTGYVVGNLATSFIAGIVVYITLRIVGVPFAFLFGLWVALVDLLPLVGGLLAGVPTVAIAFIHSVEAGIVTLVVFLVYQQIENHILNPLIMSKTVRLNPLWVMLSVLAGANLAGIVGALLAIPTAGAIQVIARDLWDERRGQLKPEPTVGEAEVPAGPSPGGDADAVFGEGPHVQATLGEQVGE